MEYVIVAVCIIALLVVGIVVYIKRKNNKTRELHSMDAKKEIVPLTKAAYSADNAIVMVEELSIEAIENDSMLMEIKDGKILAHVNNLVPNLAQAGNAVNNTTQAIKASNLYKVIIPAGAKLSDSKAMEGAVRGIYHGANGVKGHANLVAVKPQKRTAVAANTAAAAMAVASMVVGQYYMTQINEALTAISDNISKIANFQDNEYKSKVYALTAQVKKIASFHVEILENQELREAEIGRLNNLEQECIELLGQANLTIADFAKKKELDYQHYKRELEEAQNWYIYQKTLLETLYKIEDLRHTLHLGTVSREQCNALLPTYIKQVQDSRQLLTAWHDDTTKRLGIEVSSARRKRDGFDGVVHWLLGLFNDDYRFRSIADETVSMIEAQTAGYSRERNVAVDLFKEDVKLIFNGGKVYYLPEEEDRREYKDIEKD